MNKLLSFFSIAMLAACGGDGSQMDADPAGIRDMADNLQVQFNLRDTAAIAAVYAPDGSILPPNAKTISGREAIEAFWSEFLASGNILGIKGTEVRTGGNIGYRIGTFTIASPHNQLLDAGKYVEVWHHTDGGWQLMYDIFNSDRAQPAQP